MKVYILFSSWNGSGNTDVRKTEGVYGSLKLAQESLLESLSKVLENEGDIYQCVPDFIVLDEERTSHNGAVLRSTEPDFRCVTISDTEQCPENKITWEIEETVVIDADPRCQGEQDLDELSRLLSHKGYKDGHFLDIGSRGICIQQMMDGKGYTDFSDPFHIKTIGLDQWGRTFVTGKWENGKEDGFVLLYHDDKEHGETVWWILPAELLTLISDAPMLKPWAVVYEEEYPDTNGYCGSLILSNGKDFLFGSICRDDNEVIEHCEIRSELMPIEGTAMVRYPWTPENDQRLLDCLNGNSEDPNLIGDDSPLYSLCFNPAPKYVLATLHFKDTPDVHETLLMKVSTDVEDDEDDKVFFYCNGVAELEALKEPDNGQDFVVEMWDPTDTMYDE